MVIQGYVSNPRHKWRDFLHQQINTHYIYIVQKFQVLMWEDRGTLMKKPPANMDVMTVTEAKVVAFFTSMNAAPILCPSPCIILKEMWYTSWEKGAWLMQSLLPEQQWCWGKWKVELVKMQRKLASIPPWSRWLWGIQQARWDLEVDHSCFLLPNTRWVCTYLLISPWLALPFPVGMCKWLWKLERRPNTLRWRTIALPAPFTSQYKRNLEWFMKLLLSDLNKVHGY